MVELAGIDDWLAQREVTVPGLRNGCGAEIVWAGAAETETEWSVVYLHGFSATQQDLRPMPDRLAAALGANLFLARLTGHGQDGDALAAATDAAWRYDAQEAIDIGHLIGRKVLLIGCSTGCTLAALALAGGAKVDGCVLVSPNFGLRHLLARLVLALPGVRHYGHLLAGSERSFPALSPEHEAFWTLRYPTRALYPMNDLVRDAWRSDLEGIATPLLMVLNDGDQVVNPAKARKVMRRWGGPVTHVSLEQGPTDDPMGHVMAGDIMSPNQTEPMVRRIFDWVGDL